MAVKCAVQVAAVGGLSQVPCCSFWRLYKIGQPFKQRTPANVGCLFCNVSSELYNCMAAQHWIEDMQCGIGAAQPFQSCHPFSYICSQNPHTRGGAQPHSSSKLEGMLFFWQSSLKEDLGPPYLQINLTNTPLSHGFVILLSKLLLCKLEGTTSTSTKKHQRDKHTSPCWVCCFTIKC